LNEHVSGRLWVGFGIVWIALALLTFDSLRNSRNNRARTDLIDPEH
jgi:chloramphenicol-sensitive protein RarD